MDETWKAIPGWEGVYEASDTGRIRSLPRQIIQGNRWGRKITYWKDGRELRLVPNGEGYLTVGLYDGKRQQIGIRVQWLIALTFLGPCPTGFWVLHNNDNKLDNRATNLRYGTRPDNIKDAHSNGVYISGVRHSRYRADIDEAEVLRLHASGWTKTRIALKMGMGRTIVRLILTGKRLTHNP